VSNILYMKEYFICKYSTISILFLLSSCVNMRNSHDIQSPKSSYESVSINKSFDVDEYNYKVAIRDSHTNQQTPSGFYLGEIINYRGKTSQEISLLWQFSEYNNALLKGEIDKAMQYYYPGAVKYYKLYFEGEEETVVMQRLIKEFSNDLIETAKQLENQGISIDIVISRPIRKVVQGETIFIVFEIATNLVSEELQIHTTPDLSVGISIDNGKNWTFNAMNEDLPNILRMSYSNEIVDTIMGSNF